MNLFENIIPLFHNQSIYTTNFILYGARVNDHMNELEKLVVEMRRGRFSLLAARYSFQLLAMIAYFFIQQLR